MYAQDYDEIYIPGAWAQYNGCLGYTGTNYSWLDVIQPYVKNTQLNICPSQPATSGYGWNYQNFGYYPCSTGTGWATPLANVQDPAGTILIGDNPDNGMYGAGTVYIYGPTQVSPPADGIGNVAGRHSDGANYAFADGHVKWLSRSQAAGKDGLWTQNPSD